jgi:hypothetical protein
MQIVAPLFGLIVACLLQLTLQIAIIAARRRIQGGGGPPPPFQWQQSFRSVAEASSAFFHIETR